MDYCCVSEGGPESGTCTPRALVSQQSPLLGTATGTCLAASYTPHVAGCECLLPPQSGQPPPTHEAYVSCVSHYLKDHGMQNRSDIKTAASKSERLGSRYSRAARRRGVAGSRGTG